VDSEAAQEKVHVLREEELRLKQQLMQAELNIEHMVSNGAVWTAYLS